MILLITGNGFDLSHDLKTSYAHFADYVLSEHMKDRSKYRKLVNIDKNVVLGSISKRKWYMHFGNANVLFKIFYNNLIMGNENWSDLERIYYHRLCSEKIVVDKLNNNFHLIKFAFEEYLCSVYNTDHSMTFYENFVDKIQERFYVLNFNYTNSWKRYNVAEEKIINIHGQLESEFNPTIFGYAADYEEREVLLKKEDDKYLQYIKRYLYNNSNQYAKLKALFDSEYQMYKGWDVVLLGHSCGASDRKILMDIFESERIQNIYIVYHNNFQDYKKKMYNIDRITTSGFDFDKIVNIHGTLRMPQYDDSEASKKGQNDFVAKLLENEENRDITVKSVRLGS